jgi:hypothetical protein
MKHLTSPWNKTGVVIVASRQALLDHIGCSYVLAVICLNLNVNDLEGSNNDKIHYY